MENSEATTSSPIMAWGQASAVPKTPVNIDKLSPELIDLILQRLSLCCQTCLGVICNTLYRRLKEKHPRPIHLHQPEWIVTLPALQNLPRPETPWVFLSKEFYGVMEFSEPEMKMKRRWWDYFQSPSIGKHAFLAAFLQGPPFWGSILPQFIRYQQHPLVGQTYWAGHPNPRGIHTLVPKPWGISGEDWTARMARVIKDDLPRWGPDWHGFWRFWEQTWVMTENWQYIEPINELRPLWLAVDAHEPQA